VYNIAADSETELMSPVGKCNYGKIIGYHFHGNVSEWLDEENKAIGGSWFDKSKKNFDTARLEETHTFYIGSRTVCQWKEYKP
jgi:hypothetical protein